MSVELLLFLVLSGFTASFIDSVVGGGGLISVPALMLTGLPASLTLGTNKLAGTMSSMTSTFSFLAAGKVRLRTVLPLFPLSLIGSCAGTLMVKQLPSAFLKPMVIVLLVAVLGYTLWNKRWGAESTFVRMSRLTAFWSGLFALVIGFYDGFFGPGTGSFLLFAFLLIGFDYVEAAGNAKVLNFASNIASLTTFALLHSVQFAYGLTMGVAMIAGALVGSRVAIRRGATYVRPLFIVVTAVLIGKQAYDLLHHWLVS